VVQIVSHFINSPSEPKKATYALSEVTFIHSYRCSFFIHKNGG